jgi:peptidoglycan/LPS O-acetylase OafA/YrhL
MQWNDIVHFYNANQLGDSKVPHSPEVQYQFYLMTSHAISVIRFHTLSILSDITMGALLAYGLFYYEGVRNYFKKLPRKSIVLPYIAAVVLVIIRDETHGEQFYPIMNWVEAIEPALFSFIFAFIIGEQHYSDESFFKFGKLKVLSRWGKYSYGLYIWHIFVIWCVFFAFRALGMQPTVDNKWVFLLQIILSLACTIAMSAFSYRFIEGPFLKFSHRFRTKGTELKHEI